MADTSKIIYPGSIFGGNPGEGKLNDLIRRLMYNEDVIAREVKGMTPEKADLTRRILGVASENPLSNKPIMLNGQEVNKSGLGATLGLGLNKINANRLKTAGLGITGAMNLAGLFDNDQMGGQIIGSLGGLGAGAIAGAIGIPIGGYGKALMTTTGGALGSLFDKLIAKKKEEEAMMQQYQGQY